jgi:hypothetical protein
MSTVLVVLLSTFCYHMEDLKDIPVLLSLVNRYNVNRCLWYSSYYCVNFLLPHAAFQRHSSTTFSPTPSKMHCCSLFARGSLCIHAHISLLRARSWFPAGQKLAGGGRAHERVDQAWRQDATIVSATVAPTAQGEP